MAEAALQNIIDSVEKFKARAKEFIVASKFQEAVQLANTHFEAACFQELTLREDVTLVHWWTKIFLSACNLRIVTTKCLTKVNTLINTIQTSPATAFKKADGTTLMSQLEKDQCLAELLYLKRSIDTAVQLADCDRTLQMFDSQLLKVAENKTDLLIMKYYVKSLLKHDELQLGVECKTGFQQWQSANLINNNVLVRLHQHKQETIKIQLAKMYKYKQFMDIESFDRLSSQAMSTHMKKPEVIRIMQALAMKYSDLGDNEKALHYIGRAEALAQQRLPSQDHILVLQMWLAKVEILLKKLKLGNEEDFKEPIEIASAAKDLAMKIFGERTLLTNQTMLTYAMTLTKIETMQEESQKWFTRAEVQFDIINNEVSFSEQCNLLFNMLLHYNFMLNDFSTTIGAEKRRELVEKLRDASAKGTNQTLMKKSLVLIQSIFVSEDPLALMDDLRSYLGEVKKPTSGIPSPSYIQIMLKFFLAQLLMQVGEMDEAELLAQQMLDGDLRAYFGHMESELAIEPMVIILNAKFGTLTAMDPQGDQASYLKLFKEVQSFAKETEKKIVAIQGESSEKLVEIYCLYSFFAFQQGNFDQGMSFQRQSTKLSLETFGENSQQFLQRLQEQIQMQQQSGQTNPQALFNDTKRAMIIAKQVLKAPEEQEFKIGIMNMHLEACSRTGETASSIETLEEIIAIYRPMVEEKKGQGPDTNLIEYLYNYSALLEKVDRKQESLAAHKECKAMVDSIPAGASDGLKLLRTLVTGRNKTMNALEDELKEQEEIAAREMAAKDLGPLDTSVNMSESGQSLLSPHTRTGQFFFAGVIVAAAASLGYLVMRRKVNN